MTSIAVFGGEGAFGAAVAGGLTALGHRVALLASGEAVANGAEVLVPCDAGSGSDVEAALSEAAAAVGALTGVVDATPAGPAGERRSLADLGADAWAERAEEPVRLALHRMQGAYRCLRGGGGRVLIVLPSLGLSGAAGLVPWVTAAEGRRAFAKVAARAWGAQDVTVNCVVVPGAVLAGEGAGLDRPGLPPPALGRPPEVAEITRTIAALLGDGLAAVTGQTVAVDGGVWMTP